uniref:Regulatory protein E2 n=2 Tax=Sus scrofa papillomavirus 1 TaxID=446138 RepID=B5SPY8_9PAPI|nr:E2 [Sus scrofa papillomavirus 1]QPZ44494.1 E2 [Sus scrofa papillomavirus 1]
MERLSQRLGALQDQQLDLIEKDSNSIGDQLYYWYLQRQEHTLLYAARKKGVTSINGQPVPTAQVSHSRASQAIEMHLALQGLGQLYAEEPWTMLQTTWESYRQTPSGTFKKGGLSIRVQFDGEKDNEMDYVLWDTVYYMAGDGGWRKGKGGWDNTGLYYLADGDKQHYVNFKTEAQKYAKLGIWKVLCTDSHHDSDLVTSTTTATSTSTQSLSGPCWDPQPPTTAAEPTSRSPWDTPPTETAARRRLATTATPCARRPQAVPADSPTPVPRWGPGQGKYPSTPDSTAKPTAAPAATNTTTDTTTAGRGSTGPQCLCDCDPKSTWGSESQAGVPLTAPLVVLKGDPNQLKCYRYRLKKGRRKSYRHCSTTWQWVGCDGVSRTGKHLLCVSFDNSAQREEFLLTAQLPQGVTATRADFPL